MKTPFPLSRRKEILLDFLLVFLFAVVLIRPFFKSKYLDKWDSIESTFISDARFLKDHWLHPQWQPLWYGGTRFDYIYPPALRYGTAVISKVTGFWPVKAYHFYVAVFYCIGIAGVYLLVRLATASRVMAWLSALAAALMSPSFLFMANMRHDAWKRLPVRLGVLSKYGEGPHMSAFALIPIALAFIWIAFERRSLAALAGAAVVSAAVVSTNFYGATALAVFYPTLLWSFWVTRQDKRIVIPAIAIPVLAYGLTAFWLVPSYLKVTTENLKYVAEPGTTKSIWIAAAVAIVFAVTSDKFARGRKERTWPGVRRRLRGLLLTQRTRPLLLQFPDFRRPVAAGPGARPGPDPVGCHGPAMVLDWPGLGAARLRGHRDSGGLLQHGRLCAVRLAPLSAFAKLPGPDRIQDFRLDLEEHAERSNPAFWIGSLLV